jgi:glucan phosphoethanolaminetransferase (alkaline phosphatase superfamily)
METIMLKNFSLNRLLVFVVVLSFAFLMIDSFLEHKSVLTKEFMSFIPIVFSFIGLIIALIAALVWKERWIRLLHVFLMTGFLIAVAGVYFHVIEDDDEEKVVTTESREPAQEEKEKPPLAPLAFGGVALIGLLGTSRKWHAEVLEKK